GEDAQKRALARPARPEDDDELALLDVERKPLQRGRRALVRGIDAEEIGGLDGGQRSLLTATPAAVVEPATRQASARRTSGQSNASASGGRGRPAPAVTDTTATTSALTTAPAATPPAIPTAATVCARRSRWRRSSAGVTPCAERSNRSPLSSRRSPTTPRRTPTAASTSPTIAAASSSASDPRASGSLRSAASDSRCDCTASDGVRGGLAAFTHISLAVAVPGSIVFAASSHVGRSATTRSP